GAQDGSPACGAKMGSFPPQMESLQTCARKVWKGGEELFGPHPPMIDKVDIGHGDRLKQVEIQADRKTCCSQLRPGRQYRHLKIHLVKGQKPLSRPKLVALLSRVI